MRLRTLAFLSGLGFVTPMQAQTLDKHDRPFMNAAVLVLGDDLLVARCAEQARMPADGAARIETWVRENEVERIRQRSRELEHDPDVRKQFDLVRRVFALPFAARGQAACKSASDATSRPDAQFARNSPEMIAALRARGAAVVSPAPVAGDTAASADRAPRPEALPVIASDLAARIDRFGFDSRAAMGFGGFITTEIYPVVLFRDGTALTDIAGLGYAGGPDAHRRAKPAAWTHWRKQGLEYELEAKDKWTKLPFRKTYSTLPAGFHLNGNFSSFSGTGNIAIGGTSSVAVSSEYTFSLDGRVVRGGSSSASTTAGHTSVLSASVAPNRRGQYHIDGFTLLIVYDDGSKEQRILVTDPDDPKSVIWLDGTGFTHR